MPPNGFGHGRTQRGMATVCSRVDEAGAGDRSKCWARASMIARNSCGPPRLAGPIRDRRGPESEAVKTSEMPITIDGLSCRTEATDESRHPDLIASDFPKGILSLCTVWKLVCSMPQIGEQRDHLLHLSYLGSDLVQRYFLPNCGTKSFAAPAALSRSACRPRHMLTATLHPIM